MRKTKENQKGITLVALVITIIILLILAGISISALTNTGIFQKAQDAKTKTAEAEVNQRETLDEYETELNKYASLADMFDETGEIEGKIHVGDYVEYIPDTANTYEILGELGTYSGSPNNTTSTLSQEMELNWRVLDIKDGQVRLISAIPTTSKIYFAGSKGYNNAVYLLDKTCKTLYNNTQLASNIQNLKIEDIQNHLTYNYTQYTNPNSNIKYGETKEYTSNKDYPNFFAKEKKGWVDNIQGTELNLSEQNKLTNETKTTADKRIKVTQTYWGNSLLSSDFEKEKYYELFINNGSDYSASWMSSRCISADSDKANFAVRIVGSGLVYGGSLYYSDDSNGSGVCAFRPIITLKSSIKIDEKNTGDGSTPEKAYAIKIAE